MSDSTALQGRSIEVLVLSDKPGVILHGLFVCFDGRRCNFGVRGRLTLLDKKRELEWIFDRYRPC